MGHHIVRSYDDELEDIDRLIRDMGELAGVMLAGATTALLGSDTGLAQRVVSDDVVMDAKQRELDERVISLIARRQPVAQDLRSVVSAIRIAADLERAGDLAKNIAKRVGVVVGGSAPRSLARSLEAMAAMVMTQLNDVVHHYVRRDAAALVELRAQDEQIDIQYTSIFRELLTYMMEDPRNISVCTHLLFCAKNLERIGDHATNVAENAYYALTGRQLPINRPKLDETGMMAGI